jgi:hypothetical protein
MPFDFKFTPREQLFLLWCIVIGGIIAVLSNPAFMHGLGGVYAAPIAKTLVSLPILMLLLIGMVFFDFVAAFWLNISPALLVRIGVRFIGLVCSYAAFLSVARLFLL